MTTVIAAPTPFVLKDASAKITALDGVALTDEIEFAAPLDRVRFDPNVTRQSFVGLSPSAVFTDQSNPSWTAALRYAQDWDDDPSLARYLYDNEGHTATFEFQPKAGVGTVWTADLVLTSGPIGGDGGTMQTAEVTCGSTKPTPST